MALYPPRTPGTDAFIRIYNDGSEAGACGARMRCVADLVATKGGKDALTFRNHGRHSQLLEGAPTVGLPWTWGRRDSNGTRFHWPRNSAIPRAIETDRSDRQARAALAFSREHG
jgi:hypothetical protein